MHKLLQLGRFQSLNLGDRGACWEFAHDARPVAKLAIPGAIQEQVLVTARITRLALLQWHAFRDHSECSHLVTETLPSLMAFGAVEVLGNLLELLVALTRRKLELRST